MGEDDLKSFLDARKNYKEYQRSVNELTRYVCQQE